MRSVRVVVLALILSCPGVLGAAASATAQGCPVIPENPAPPGGALLVMEETPAPVPAGSLELGFRFLLPTGPRLWAVTPWLSLVGAPMPARPRAAMVGEKRTDGIWSVRPRGMRVRPR